MQEKKVNEAARSGKCQTVEEVLELIQRQHVRDYFLMWEHWDWLVVLQCMQDHGRFKRTPQRPPLKEFVEWLSDHHIPQGATHYDERSMSYAHNQIHGARYPWDGVEWRPCVLERWRTLYRQLSYCLEQLPDDEM